MPGELFSFSQQNYDTLRNAYRNLSAEQQIAVQFLSVLYQPCSRTDLGRALFLLNFRSAQNKALQAKELAPYLDPILQAGLMMEQPNGRVACHPLFAEIGCRLSLQDNRFETLVAAANKIFPAQENYHWRYSSPEQALREARVALYRQDSNAVLAALSAGRRRFGDSVPDETLFYLMVYGNPFDPAWFKKVPPRLAEPLLMQINLKMLTRLEPRGLAFDMLAERCAAAKPGPEETVCRLLMELYVLFGGWTEAEALAKGRDDGEMQGLSATLAFLRGHLEESLAQYQIGLALLKKASRKRKVYFESMAGVFFPLALARRGDALSLHQAQEQVALAKSLKINRFYLIYEFLHEWLNMLHGDKTSRATLARRALSPAWSEPPGQWGALTNFFLAFVKFWADAEQARSEFNRVAEMQRLAADNGYAWMAVELAELLAALAPAHKNAAAVRAQAVQAFPFERSPLTEVYKPRPAWESALDALIHLRSSIEPAQAAATAAEKTSRLVWGVSWRNSEANFEPREQKSTAKGGWTKGRLVSLKRLREEADELDFLTPQDRQAAQMIREERSSRGYYGYYDIEYEADPRMALALAGHPLLFWADNPDVRVDLSKGEPELRVSKLKGERLAIGLHPVPQYEGQEVVILKDSPTRLKAVEFTAGHQRILDILGQKGLEVPESAKEQVLRAISSIAALVTVHSDIGGGTDNAEEVPADPTPRMHLLPFAAGLKASLLVRPFPGGGPHYPPGSGGETLVAEVEGKRLQTRRDLKDEKQRAKAVLDACPTLERVTEEDGEWLLEDPQDCLELLSELQALAEQVAVEWPEGQTFRLAGLAGLGQFSLRIQRDNDWFGLSGEVRVSDQEVLDMQRLLSLLDRGKGRFVQLENGQFLALTDEFRKRLNELRAYSEQHGKKLRIHPLAALALQDFDEEIADLETDKHWKDHIRRLREAENYRPALPGTFQAELRDYQMDGFQWLARLAYWGVGGCLADDMGLGKTLQALAVILLRAPDGPSLVVAPTSVCLNWEAEAQRFTPTLRVMVFGTGDRQRLLDNLQPYDLLLCSYGLLQQESVAELLAKIAFQTIVLDEAQAIKNVATKRSQGAMALQGGFKLITTGTPVENHLGELWNLFRFANPGLLGSLERFNTRFAGPIERNQDKQARQQLKKLIQPFILRRTKSQVLQELPPRTEIPIHVELSKEESAFYEAVRREALEKLAGLKGPAGQKQLQILAEIMRMRRACCNVRLVSPTLALPSSKLDAFGEILDELLENKHKALVFSQFVDHLSLIREYLDKRKVSYQYLDGSTPQKERKQNMDAFQRGEGDLFLISLKAGGVGLNLTAADYVIHMDPWWNPAVEDQASDRAHRIGQQRPVTIYRLIAKNTIEEKIVDLHQHKRDLADSLLEGADVSGKMSADELMKLMTEE